MSSLAAYPIFDSDSQRGFRGTDFAELVLQEAVEPSV